MWKKVGGSLVAVGICLNFLGGTPVQADSATSHVGITFSGYSDSTKPTPPSPSKENTKPSLPGTGKKTSPVTGTLPVTGDKQPILEMIGGLLLCFMSLCLLCQSGNKIRKKERIN